jgi:hypothetical protein
MDEVAAKRKVVISTGMDEVAAKRKVVISTGMDEVAAKRKVVISTGTGVEKRAVSPWRPPFRTVML